MTGYHCSKDSALQISTSRSLCVADDRNAASAYLRGGDDAVHHLYTVEWDSSDVTAADESAIVSAWRDLYPRREWDESALPIWDAVKDGRLRAVLMADGYDTLVYGDSHAGCEYTTTEFLRLPASLRIVACEVVAAE